MAIARGWILCPPAPWNRLCSITTHRATTSLAASSSSSCTFPLPLVRLAWDSFGEANGARSLMQVKKRIAKYWQGTIGVHDDPNIGCVILVEPLFFPEED